MMRDELGLDLVRRDFFHEIMGVLVVKKNRRFCTYIFCAQRSLRNWSLHEDEIAASRSSLVKFKIVYISFQVLFTRDLDWRSNEGRIRSKRGCNLSVLKDLHIVEDAGRSIVQSAAP